MSEPQRVILERRRVGGIGCGGFLLILFVWGGLQAGWDEITGNTDDDKTREFQREEVAQEAKQEDRIATREERIMDRLRSARHAAEWRVESVAIDGKGLTVLAGISSVTKAIEACEFARAETSTKWAGISVLGEGRRQLAQYYDDWGDCIEAAP